MRIQSLYVTDFLGVRAVDVKLRAPVLLVSGHNAAGKSSLRDAIALALTADLGRVHLKKEAGQLVRSGASAAVLQVTNSDGDAWHVTIKPGGQIIDSAKGREVDPSLPLALDGQRFARLSADERRRFVFDLLSIKTDATEIRDRLNARQLDRAKVERIVPLLRSGFEAAEAEAKRQATESRGAWKAVTGEVYGSEKARHWQAPVPEYDPDVLKARFLEVTHADAALATWRESLGKAAAQLEQRRRDRERLAALEAEAALLPRRQAKLEVDHKSRNEAQAALQAAEQRAGTGPRVGLIHDLAAGLNWALAFVLVQRGDDAAYRDARAALEAYVAEHGGMGAAGDAEAAAQLPELRRQVELYASAVRNSERDVNNSAAAQAGAEKLKAELAEQLELSSTYVEEVRQQIADIEQHRKASAAALAVQEAAKDAAHAADAKTALARQHADAVRAWEALAEQLSPAGIPADLLREALDPIHQRLAQHAADTGWAQVRLTEGMDVLAGDRPYRLLSESERWRVDAMLAEVIAHLSGTRLVLLDRFDVLDLQGRGELLTWLDTLAGLGEIDTAVVFATLKAAPERLPENVQGLWMERGHARVVAAGRQPVAEAA